MTTGFRSESEMFEALLCLAKRGWLVFPCHSAPGGKCSCGKFPCGTNNRNAGKHPRTKHGVRDATGGEKQIRAWVQGYPGCNWAVATGPGLFVLDVDGEKGRKSLAELEAQHGKLPQTLSCRTGREDGGEQRYFTCPPHSDIRSSVEKVGAGLDVKGAGGYAIIPPSIHRTGRPYEWLNPDASIAVAPDWLLDVVTSPLPDTPRIPVGRVGILAEGKRNDGLFRHGCALRRKGAARGEIEFELLQANARRCQPPLLENEVRKVAASAAKYPVGGPDPLEVAWQATQAEPHLSDYQRFLALCRQLQLARPEMTIALPLERIGELFGRDWTQVRRWRKRAVNEGRLRLMERYVPQRRAGLYSYFDCPTRADVTKQKPTMLTTVPLGVQVPLTCTTSGLVGHPEFKSVSGYVEGWL